MINRRFRVLEDFNWDGDMYRRDSTATTEIGFFEIPEDSNEADHDLLDHKKVYTLNKWCGFGTSFNHNSEIAETRKISMKFPTYSFLIKLRIFSGETKI